jgi:hypothetical protein
MEAGLLHLLSAAYSSQAAPLPRPAPSCHQHPITTHLLLPQIHGLPTLIFIGMDASKPALRTEGLLPAQASPSRTPRAACLTAGGCRCLPECQLSLHEPRPLRWCCWF